MYQDVEWLKPSDHVIASKIRNAGMWLKPSSVSLNVSFTQQHVQRRCKAMAEHGLLERHPDDPAYRVSELGERWLAGGLQPADLAES